MENTTELQTAPAQPAHAEKNWTMNALGLITVIGFLVMGFLLLLRGLREMSTQEAMIVGSVVGTAGTMCGMVLSYYFGSSRGSSAKDRIIEKQMQ